jgi:hypothetical protein
MSNTELDNEPFELSADPPDGGGGTKSALNSPQKPVPVDPPDGGGGTGG